MTALTDRIAEVLQTHPILDGGISCGCGEWRAWNQDGSSNGCYEEHVAERIAEALHEARVDFRERLELAATTLDGMYQKALHPSDPGMSRLAGKAEGVRLALSYLAESERVAEALQLTYDTRILACRCRSVPYRPHEHGVDGCSGIPNVITRWVSGWFCGGDET